jgi:hypothetical protein
VQCSAVQADGNEASWAPLAIASLQHVFFP